MNNDETKVFDVDNLENYMITETLKNVRDALNEKGYNAIVQIVGYLVDGDLAYISNYKNARNNIKKIDREKIVEALLKNYLKDVK